MEEEQHLAAYAAHDGAVNAIAGRTQKMFFASASDDTTVRVWKKDTTDLLCILLGHIGSVDALELSVHTDVLFSGGTDRLLHMWSLETGRQTQTYLGHKAKVTAVCESARGTVYTAGRDARILCWDVRSASYEEVFCVPSPIHCLSVCAHTIAAGCADGTVLVGDLRTGTAALHQRHHKGVRGLLAAQERIFSISHDALCVADTSGSTTTLCPRSASVHALAAAAHACIAATDDCTLEVFGLCGTRRGAVHIPLATAPALTAVCSIPDVYLGTADGHLVRVDTRCTQLINLLSERWRND